METRSRLLLGKLTSSTENPNSTPKVAFEKNWKIFSSFLKKKLLKSYVHIVLLSSFKQSNSLVNLP
jgi:D-alanyl-lipoteichoic acid acyltransferase DltB (MBOAT superfamily)